MDGTDHMGQSTATKRKISPCRADNRMGRARYGGYRQGHQR